MPLTILLSKKVKLRADSSLREFVNISTTFARNVARLKEHSNDIIQH